MLAHYPINKTLQQPDILPPNHAQNKTNCYTADKSECNNVIGRFAEFRSKLGNILINSHKGNLHRRKKVKKSNY